MAGALVRWCVARCGGGGWASPVGWPATVVRGAWCQALSLLAVPKSRGWSADFPWLVHVGAAGRGWGSSYAGSADRHSCVCVGIRCSPPAVRGGPLRGASEAGHSPPSSCPPPGARCPRAVGTGVRVRGPALSPWPVFPVFLRGGQAGFLGLRVRCEGRLRSGAPPPPTVRPLGGLSGSVIHSCCGRGCAGVGARRCPLGLHALWKPRAAGVVGGRPRGGRPATVVRGVWCQTLSLPQPPALWGG